MTDQPMTEQQTDPAVAHHDDALDHHRAENGAATSTPTGTSTDAATARTSDDRPEQPAVVDDPAAMRDEEPVGLNGVAAAESATPAPVLTPVETPEEPEETVTLAEAVDLVAPAEPAEVTQAADVDATGTADGTDGTDARDLAEPADQPPVEALTETATPAEPEVPAEATTGTTVEAPAEATAQTTTEAATEAAAETTAEAAAEAAPEATAAEEAAAVPPPSVLAAPAKQPATPAAALPAHAPLVRPALTDPARWGRIDAERNVYVRTADGERLVGSWQAGEPEEGLAHFARRFDDLLTEVELIAARLASGHGDPKQSLATVRQLKESLAEAHVVGDVVGLDAKLDYLLAKAEQAMGAAREAREAARTESTARKQALVEEAERIAAEATQWKQAGDRLREILDEWKTIRGVDRKVDDALWKRFGKARDAFNRRRGSHFAEMDRQRGAAKARKEEIVAEAEELSQSSEWGATAGRYKQLMTDWKAAGRAPKDADDALWQRFRGAQDTFFARRSAAFSERDSELVDNARRKEELLAEAERIDPATDLEGARAHLHRLQERWEAVGHVPRERMRELESRLRAVEERVRGAVEAQWRRTDPETEARVAQFRERVEQFETQAAKARAAGDERRAKRADEQAAQWREWLAAAEQAVADR